LAKKVKSVSFNDEVAEEKEILKFVSRRNFSKYVKHLIKQDMVAKLAEKSSKKLQLEQETYQEPSSDFKTPTSPKKNLYEHYR
jgi:hypothetical protein